MNQLVSPTSGLPLYRDCGHSLTDGHRRWPLVDDIPYLRVGREALVARALAALDADDRESALIILLADQDDWWDGPPASEDDLRRLVRAGDRLSLQEAMAALAYGRVGDYFAHRWSDPTFAAGLALLDGHWTAPERALELACGIGHYLRELALRQVATTGADVVFSKLWLARHWVVPSATLVCFDAAAPWPVRGAGFDLVLCHDAFYFLEPKPHVLSSLRSLVGSGGTLAIAHIHNRQATNLSAGAGMTSDEIVEIFPSAAIFDDAEWTRAATGHAAPVASPPHDLRGVAAFSLIEATRGIRLQPAPTLDRPVRLNPLYAPSDGGYNIVWPSERYRAEYGRAATYRHRIEGEPRADPAAIRRREFIDLPERW